MRGDLRHPDWPAAVPSRKARQVVLTLLVDILLSHPISLALPKKLPSAHNEIGECTANEVDSVD